MESFSYNVQIRQVQSDERPQLEIIGTRTNQAGEEVEIFHRAVKTVSSEKAQESSREIFYVQDVPVKGSTIDKMCQAFSKASGEELLEIARESTDQNTLTTGIKERVEYVLASNDLYSSLMDALSVEITDDVKASADKYLAELQKVASLQNANEEKVEEYTELRAVSGSSTLKDEKEAQEVAPEQEFDPFNPLMQFEPIPLTSNVQFTYWEDAAGFVAECAGDTSTVFSQDTLLEINRRLVNNEEAGFRSKFYEDDVRIANNVFYVPTHLVEDAMKGYMNWFSEQLTACDENKANPIVFAALAYQKLVSIHPFDDGNGRTARLVMDYILLRYDIPPPAFEKSDQVKLGNFGRQYCMPSESDDYAEETKQRNEFIASNNAEATPSIAVQNIIDGIKKAVEVLELEEGRSEK